MVSNTITGNLSLTITAQNSAKQSLLPITNPSSSVSSNYPPQQNFAVSGTELLTSYGLPVAPGGTSISLPEDGVSLLYVHNLGGGNVNVVWTPVGGGSETIIGLPSGAELNFVLPSGAGGISALSLASTQTVALVSLLNGIFTADTSALSVGQLISLTSGPPLLQFGPTPITSIPTANTFTVGSSAGGTQALTQAIPNTNQTLTLSAAANASGNSTVYTGTITGGGSNAFAGFQFVITGFTNSGNNGTFFCTASTGTTLTLSNVTGVSETHAGSAVSSSANCGYLTATSLAAVFPNQLVGCSIQITGFTNSGNNELIGGQVTSSDVSAGFVILNSNGVAETHSATATFTGAYFGFTVLYYNAGAGAYGVVEYAILG
jgi:hypothetical protein